MFPKKQPPKTSKHAIGWKVKNKMPQLGKQSFLGDQNLAESNERLLRGIVSVKSNYDREHLRKRWETHERYMLRRQISRGMSYVTSSLSNSNKYTSRSHRPFRRQLPSDDLTAYTSPHVSEEHGIKKMRGSSGKRLLPRCTNEQPVLNEMSNSNNNNMINSVKKKLRGPTRPPFILLNHAPPSLTQPIENARLMHESVMKDKDRLQIVRKYDKTVQETNKSKIAQQLRKKKPDSNLPPLPVKNRKTIPNKTVQKISPRMKENVEKKPVEKNVPNKAEMKKDNGLLEGEERFSSSTMNMWSYYDMETMKKIEEKGKGGESEDESGKLLEGNVDEMENNSDSKDETNYELDHFKLKPNEQMRTIMELNEQLKELNIHDLDNLAVEFLIDGPQSTVGNGNNEIIDEDLVNHENEEEKLFSEFHSKSPEEIIEVEDEKKTDLSRTQSTESLKRMEINSLTCGNNEVLEVEEEGESRNKLPNEMNKANSRKKTKQKKSTNMKTIQLTETMSFTSESSNNYSSSSDSSDSESDSDSESQSGSSSDSDSDDESSNGGDSVNNEMILCEKDDEVNIEKFQQLTLVESKEKQVDQIPEEEMSLMDNSDDGDSCDEAEADDDDEDDDDNSGKVIMSSTDDEFGYDIEYEKDKRKINEN
ncbi:hypothetical protein SNEBB_003663 [Seison nebaliae]|nr:hypothetical protein SNEBB_003663 [Seison nebaliae]